MIGSRVKLRASFLACVLSLVVLALVSSAPVAAHDARYHLDPGGALGTPNHFMTSLSPTSVLKASAMSSVNCINDMAGSFPCHNVDLLAYLDTNSVTGVTGSDIEGWTDPQTGKEWAIQGHSDATTFIDVSNPEAPVVFGTLLPAIPSVLWKELEVYDNHVYVVQDLVGAGMQIFDLTRLRTAAPGVVFTADFTYTGVENTHTITINQDTGFVYLNGTNTCSGGAPHMLDLNPHGAFGPENPEFVGCIPGQGYAHDAQCVVYHGPDTAHVGKEICVVYTGQGANADTMAIYDVTNHAAPVLLSRVGYTTGTDKYSHQGWFTEDQRYILLDDELDEEGSVKTRTYLWNVADLENPVLITPWQHQTTCTDHNQFIIGRFSYQSNYACGLRVMDISEVGAGKLSQVAYFDTAPAHDFIAGASDGGDLDGDWANYPYFRSGIVVTSNISKGLFVLKPHLPTASGAVLLSHDAEDGTEGWTVSHEGVADDDLGPPAQCDADEWHQTSTDYHSSTHAWTNSPYDPAFPGVACINYLTSPSISVPPGANVTLTFWEHHFTEGGTVCNPPQNDPETCDFGEVELSVDNGATWKTVSNRYDGGGPNNPYIESSLPLGSLGGKTIRVRFKFTSDSTVSAPPYLGWAVDDIEVRATVPTAATVASFSARRQAPAGVRLSWRTASEIDALGFNVWRVSTGTSAKVNRALVAAKAAGRTRGATYSLRDRMAGRSAYTYRLQVVHRDGSKAFVGTATVR